MPGRPRALPRLHLVTDDAVLADAGFARTAGELVRIGGARIALHLRGHATAVARLYELAVTLRTTARQSGALLFVNDRVDVALCANADGVQLGMRSLPVEAARRVLPDALIGTSVHGADEALDAARAGTDFVLVGTIWATSSHPGHEGSGVGRVAAVRAYLEEAVAESAAARETRQAAVKRLATPGAAGRAAVMVPVVAIGGVTPERLGEVAHAGGYGAAVLGGIWRAAHPTAALEHYLAACDSHWSGTR